MKLYIIGNGFDIYHGIKSKYADFKDYVKNNDNELFDTLDNYFDTDELWSDFEETLAYIDTDTITDDAENFLVPYGAENWSDAYHNDYQYEIQRAIDIVTVQLKEHFTNWILQLNIPKTVKINIDNESEFLSFNYTETLEKTYRIEPQKIFHIHNKVLNTNSLLILGHSRTPSELDTFSGANNDSTDVRVAEGNEILDKYFEDTYKNTETIIRENRDYFMRLTKIKEVFVLGHSISLVDIRYFQEIKERVDINTIWTVSYLDTKQKDENRNKIIALGINDSQIKMVKLDELKI